MEAIVECHARTAAEWGRLMGVLNWQTANTGPDVSDGAVPADGYPSQPPYNIPAFMYSSQEVNGPAS